MSIWWLIGGLAGLVAIIAWLVYVALQSVLAAFEHEDTALRWNREDFATEARQRRLRKLQER